MPAGLSFAPPRQSLRTERYLSSYTFLEKDTGQVEDETIFITFMELYRFRRERLGDCRDGAERRCWVLKNMQTIDGAGGESTMYLEFADLLWAFYKDLYFIIVQHVKRLPVQSLACFFIAES